MMIKLFILFLGLSAIGCKAKNNSGNISIAAGEPADSMRKMPPETGNNSDSLPLIFNTSKQAIARDSIQVDLAKGLHFKLLVPRGYHVSIAAEGLQRLRFMAMSPDGRLFCTDMYDKSDNNKGKVYIFDNWNDSSKRFQKIITYSDSLHNPNQVAFYKDFIYVAETDKLVRYPYAAGDTAPSGAAQVIATFPAYGLSYKYGGWHLTRSIAFHKDKLYVSVGSSCNACIESEEIRASVVEMNPDGSQSNFFARGLRNSVGIKWLGDEFWATTMGRDLIGPDKPEELLVKIQRDGYYGWPFYFQYHNKVYDDTQFKDSLRASWVKKPGVAYAGFAAHSAPLGFEYMKNFEDPYLRNSLLVCLHGSTTVSRQRGNAIVRAEGGTKYSELISGFLTGKTEDKRFGRPCDILMKDGRSFFFTDDKNGVLYYVWH